MCKCPVRAFLPFRNASISGATPRFQKAARSLTRLVTGTIQVVSCQSQCVTTMRGAIVPRFFFTTLKCEGEQIQQFKFGNAGHRKTKKTKADSLRLLLRNDRLTHCSAKFTRSPAHRTGCLKIQVTVLTLTHSTTQSLGTSIFGTSDSRTLKGERSSRVYCKNIKAE